MRESIIQPRGNKCYICGKYTDLQTHHVLHGTSMRKKADEDGLTVKLCIRCHADLHDKGDSDRLLQQVGQYFWEQNYGTRDQFRSRYGKSFL